MLYEIFLHYSYKHIFCKKEFETVPPENLQTMIYLENDAYFFKLL